MVEVAVEAVTAGAEALSGKTRTRGAGNVVDGGAAHPQQRPAQLSPKPSNHILPHTNQCKSINAPVMGLISYKKKPFIVETQPIIPPTENHKNSITGNKIKAISNTSK